MKKFFLIFVFTILIFSGKTYAQPDLISPSVSAVPTPSPSSVNYAFPYPGILPGNFLYNLKALRDRVMELLISDPSRKSSFYLLSSDKRFSASLMLFDRGEYVLSETTLSKSQNYLEKAITKAEEVHRLKGRFSEADNGIKLSAAKQIEELEKLTAKIKGETAQKFKGDLERAKQLKKRAEKL